MKMKIRVSIFNFPPFNNREFNINRPTNNRDAHSRPSAGLA